MIEFVATIAIIVSSALLFAYWFRYTSLLILSARTTRDYATEVAMANQLSFLEVQSRLREGAGSELDRLRDLLDRDFAVVRYLLDHASNTAVSQATFETGMLAVNYRMMRAWYRVSSRFSESTACRALEEMSQVVAHFANTMGERAAAGAAA
jgi:hypothetical protein